MKERLLYQQADFENFKKLKAREKQEVLRFGNETLIKELLPVIDNLERAIEHAGKTEEAKSIAEGVALTLSGFLKVLEKFDVTPGRGQGRKFDPNLHEADLPGRKGRRRAGDRRRRVPERIRHGRQAPRDPPWCPLRRSPKRSKLSHRYVQRITTRYWAFPETRPMRK